MLPTWVNQRKSSEEIGHLGPRESFGEQHKKALRIAVTQPTREDTFPGKKFACLLEHTVEAYVAKVSDEMSNSDTEVHSKLESKKVRV